MDSSLFLGGSILAAVVAGVLALFAPCCVSVMLPAYFAGSFQNRRMLVAMTFLFAAGVATIILPIALGVSLIRQVLFSQHTLLYVAGGLIMLGLAVYTLLGGQLQLPLPSHRAGGRTGVLGVYSLGIYSGMASSCCAPVLAGVLALTSLADSFWLALGLGVAYVFGMVAPLFAISLLWERYQWRASELFKHKTVTMSLGRLERTVTATSLASGVLLLLIGGAMIWAGIVGMRSPTGWQASFTVWLQQAGRNITSALSWVPGWAVWLVLLAVIGLLAWYALRQIGSDEQEPDMPDPSPDIVEEAPEEVVAMGTKEENDG